jgi:RAD3-like DEAD/DEAH box helicase
MTGRFISSEGSCKDMTPSFVPAQAMAKVSFLRLYLSLAVPVNSYLLSVHLKHLNVTRYMLYYYFYSMNWLVDDVIQAEQAIEKGIDAIVINEDTTHSSALWTSARTSAAMVYMSPEMVLSESFLKLWKNSHFRTRLTAIVVDEAHCIDEWGGEDFRPEYRQLERLRIYTGQEVPIVSVELFFELYFAYIFLEDLLPVAVII